MSTAITRSAPICLTTSVGTRCWAAVGRYSVVYHDRRTLQGATSWPERTKGSLLQDDRLGGNQVGSDATERNGQIVKTPDVVVQDGLAIEHQTDSIPAFIPLGREMPIWRPE